MVRASILALCALLAGCAREENVEVGPGGELLVGTHRAAATETRGVLLGGRRLVLEGFAGSVHVVGGPAGSPASLTFERVARGRTDVAAQRLLQDVRVEESGDGSAYTFRMSAGQAQGAEVNVQAVLPRDAAVAIRLATGAVRVDTLSGDLEVSLDAGPVRGTGLGGRRVQIEAGSGAVALDAARLAPAADWDVSTQAGSITLGLPPATSARLRAETRTGTIRVLGLQFENRRLDRRGTGMRFSGTLGDGDGGLDVSTDVGTIRLRSVPAARANGSPGP